MYRLVAIAVVGILVTAGQGVAKRPKPAPCPSARYVVVEGAPLVGDDATTNTDVIAVAPGEVTVAGSCTAAAAIKPAKKATRVRARWESCATLTKLKLSAKIAAPECTEMQGALKAKKTKAHRFRAVLSTCGDGYFDPGGETCDAGEGCDATERCTATCTCRATAPGTVPMQGVIELPTGSDLLLSTLQVVGLNATPIRSDGSFEFDASTSGPTLVLIADGEGRPVLGGYADPRRSERLRINARSTALALLFFASGAFTRPQDDFQQVLDLLLAHPAFPALAAATETVLAADSRAIADGDSQLLAAIQTAIDTMSQEPSATSATRAARAAAVVSGSPVDPPDAQSGIIVEYDANTGLQITNTRRRHLLVYVKQTGFKDAQDQMRHPVDNAVPVVEGSFPHDLLPSTNKLYGAIGSLIDVFAGSGAYQPSHTEPVALPVLPPGSTEAYYQVTVVGPGVDPGGLPQLGAEPFQSGATQMLAWSFFKDLFLPFLFAGLDAHLDIQHLADPTPLFQGFRGFVTLIGSSGHVALILSNGTHAEPKEIMIAVFKTLADEPAFRQLFINWFRDLVLKLAPQVGEAIGESALNGLATKINFWLAIIDKAMSLGDAVVAASDIRNSDWFEEWEVTAIPVPVHLSPGTATVTKDAPGVTFTATVTGVPNGQFVYRYTTTGTHGVICPLVGDCGTTADSTFNTVQYVADPSVIVDGDLDIVTVEVFEDSGSGTIPPGAEPIGSATSQIRGEVPCPDPEAVVDVPSNALRSILRQQLAIPAGEDLTCADMQRLTSLSASANINTLEGLQFATNLTNLSCNFCLLDEVPQLSKLRKLTSLSLPVNGINDLTPLAELTALTSLNLYWNNVADLTPLAGLTALTSLSLEKNEVTDVSALAGLTQLEELSLRENQITSVTALAGLVKMKTLTLSFNGLATLAGLEAMTALEQLKVEYNYNLSDISALSDLNALSVLDAGINSIEDIGPLNGKSALVLLNLRDNYIADLGTVDWGSLPLGQLDLSTNVLTNIAPLEGLNAVSDLDVSYNRISDAGPVQGLGNLHQLSMRNNLISDLQPLVDNGGLAAGDVVNIQQNCLSESDPDIQTLKNRGVTVEYKPQGCTP